MEKKEEKEPHQTCEKTLLLPFIAVCVSLFSGMPFSQAISILQKHCRIIKNVQVLYSEQVGGPNSIFQPVSLSHTKSLVSTKMLISLHKNPSFGQQSTLLEAVVQ